MSPRFARPGRGLRLGAACALAAAAGLAAVQEPIAQDASASDGMVVAPYEEGGPDFAPLNPEEEGGPEISVRWGDVAAGPSSSLMRFPQDYGGRLHTHTADYHLFLFVGTMKHWAAGETEDGSPELGPGSYWFQPGGEVHADNCLSEFCIAFVKFEGPIDAQYVE